MDFNSEDAPNIIILNDEDGNEVQFEFLDLMEFAERKFVVLLPTDDDADEVVILEVDESGDDEEESYVGIEDPDLLNTLYEMFKDKFRDVFNFKD